MFHETYARVSLLPIKTEVTNSTRCKENLQAKWFVHTITHVYKYREANPPLFGSVNISAPKGLG